MVARRFHVYLANLDPTIGREIGKTRPCVVVSPYDMHRYLDTVVIVPLTSARKNYPTRVPSTFGDRSGTMAMDQIRSVDGSRLLKHLGQLSPEESTALQEALLDMFS